MDKALRLLSLFATEETIRVKDAADTLGVATGTAHRLLAMLVYRGYVTRNATTKAYGPGPVLLSVGLRAASRLDLGSQAKPYLEALNREVDETVSLAVLRGTDVLFVDAFESQKTLKVASRAGAIHPAHCTSVGKAILAELPRDRLLRLYPDEELPQVTPRSISSRVQLLVELESTIARGYAINFGELEEGIGSLAVAVRDTPGSVVAAIGVGAPVFRLGEDRLQELARAAQSTAAQLSAELLAVPPNDRMTPMPAKSSA